MNDDELRALISKYLTLRVKLTKELIAKLDISERTYYRKIANPSEFRLSELRAIFDYLKIPQTERTI